MRETPRLTIDTNRSIFYTIYEKIRGARFWTTLALVSQIVHAAQHLGHADY